jgi:hypothetical protein
MLPDKDFFPKTLFFTTKKFLRKKYKKKYLVVKNRVWEIKSTKKLCFVVKMTTFLSTLNFRHKRRNFAKFLLCE